MEDARPPAPDGLPLLGNAVDFGRDPLTFTTDAVDSVGDVFRIDLPVGDRYVLAHPEYAERVLVSERDAFEKTDDFALAFGNSVVAVDGEDWREQREFLDPFFYASRIRAFLPTMRERVVDRAESWEGGDTLATVSEMKALTFDVLAATLLGFDPGSNGADLRRAADDLNSYFDPVTWALPDWVPTPSGRRFDAAKDTLRAELLSLLEEAAGTDEESLLAALAAATDGAGSPDTGGGPADGDYPRDRDAAVDQLIGLVFAGHETTALALTYTLYCLAEHPETYDRVEAEIDEVLGEEPIRWEHLDDLPTLERAFDESLRLYPPVHALPREATRPVEFDGREIPAGAELLVSVFAMHRDERFWDDPEAFDPTRWKARDRSADAYLPFGAGPRRCIGATFASVEARVVLAELLRRYRFEYAGDGDLSLSPEMTNQPDGDVPMTVHRR
ncbi:cytochrome P450 [Halobellus limi]|uniref:Cytochrome P450 n=1 Tax=Halobellus limi TaxID=699433 RepID=A0A1H5T9N8_9EURY|nr:cytochrome P450 [Halobellus limi]QCC47368.1 cytochrome P450 [Halobellus limi]SEF59464.1 Cytochrome P450 [Halobellus limi]